MAENKKQHYVPRFYLRLFSWGNRKFINIYNISSENPIFNGDLNSECYEPYFYGKNPDVEKAFKGLEDIASPIIKQIIGSNSAPERGTIEYYAIIHYVLFQLSRTKSAAETEDEYIDTLTKFVAEKKGMVTREKLDQVEFININSASISLATMAQSIPIAMDLMCKVLVNKTSINYITSDNPVVLYNRAYEQSKVFGHTGLASKGLKIIFPISPKHILLFYDEKIYKVGARKHRFADVIVESDIQQFNDLQWLNALENIYFDNTLPRTEIRRGASKNIKKRNTKKDHIHIGDTQNEADGRQSALIYMYNPLDSSQNIQMNMQCIKQLRALSEEEMNNGAKSIRNPEMLEIYREFLRLVDEGKYKASEFGVFIKDNLAIS